MNGAKIPKLNRRKLLLAGGALLAAPAIMTRAAFAITPDDIQLPLPSSFPDSIEGRLVRGQLTVGNHQANIKQR